MAQPPLAGDGQGLDAPREAPLPDPVPLFVDLDGTLIASDTLWESFAAGWRVDPVATVLGVMGLWRGRALLKQQMAAAGSLDVSLLPYREPFVAWLREQREKGRRIVLATAADSSMAQAVADHLQLFDDVLASDGVRNLKGLRKLEAIRAVAGGAFDYCGNGPEDLAILRAARQAIVVGAGAGVIRRARHAGNVQAVLEPSPSTLRSLPAWIDAMRPHQWLKNLLLLVPLVTSFRVDEIALFSAAVFAMISFSLGASAGYLVNDLLDLAADRRHPRKRGRPFASGLLPISGGFALAALLLAGSLGLGFAISRALGAWVVIYLLMTFGYTLFVKRVPVLDVAMLAGLYTVRILAGGAAIGVDVSFWLLSFSVFLFFSLALVKRCGELVSRVVRDEDTGQGRGYTVSDLTVLQPLGIATSVAAVLVLALYVNTPEVARRYASPQLLWLMLTALLIWLGRLWLATARGQMHDDPLVYAIESPDSRWLVAAMFATYAVAALWQPGLV